MEQDPLSALKQFNFFSDQYALGNVTPIYELKYALRQAFEQQQYRLDDLLSFLDEHSQTPAAGLVSTVLCEYVCDTAGFPTRNQQGKDFFSAPSTLQAQAYPLDRLPKVFTLASSQDYGFIAYEKDYLINPKAYQGAYAKTLFLNAQDHSGFRAYQSTLSGVASDHAFKQAVQTKLINKSITLDHAFKEANGSILYQKSAAYNNSFMYATKTTLNDTASAHDYSFYKAMHTIFYDRSSARDFSFLGASYTSFFDESYVLGLSLLDAKHTKHLSLAHRLKLFFYSLKKNTNSVQVLDF
ncbi:MAG: hypothetical protein QW594_01055 [Candidatus Woesearchaeota archaeon]